MSRGVVSLSMGGGITPVQMPASGSGLPAMESGLSAVQASGGKRGIWQPGQEGLFQPEGGIRDKRRRVDSYAGEKLPATGGPLDGKRTGLQTNPFPRTPLPIPQRVVNRNQPITRIVIRGAPGMSALDTVAKNEFAWLHRSTRDPTIPGKAASSSVLPLTLMDGSTQAMNIAPVVALTGACLNYYMLHVQLNMYRENPAAFFALSAADWIRDWTCDGVTISEEMLNGAESQTRGGYGRRGRWKGGDGFKVATNNISGECHVINVFGDGVTEGASLLAVVRKHRVPAGGFQFELDVRPQTPSSTAPGGTVLPDSAYVRGMRAGRSASLAAELAESPGFMPFLMTYMATPDGDLPFDYRYYLDEHDIVQPSHVIHLGRCLIAPQDHTPRPLPRNPANGPQPALDARDGITRGLMKIIVNPRGVNPLV
jgi:hypothetical protein